MATTIVRKMASQINGGQLLLAEDVPSEGKEDLSFAEKWAKDVDLSNKIDTAIEYAGAGGTSILKLNSDGEDLWFEPMRLDTFFMDVDWKGEVVNFKGFVYGYTKTVPEAGKNYIYYLLEERYFDDKGKPFAKYIVKRATENITTAREVDMRDVQQIQWNEIPKEIRKSISRDYNILRVDEPIALPFEDSLGIFVMKYTNHVSNVPALHFGESVYSTMISYLLSYDYYYSAMNTNMYLGRSRVMIPKTMQNQNLKHKGNYNDGLDSFTYVKLPYTNGNQDQKPIPLQFDLRDKSWLGIRNIILEGLATSMGINSSTLASYLSDGGARTAKEISTEEGATSLYVQNKRELVKIPINKMLDVVMKFYGKKPNIVAKFSKAGLTNIRNLVEIAQILSTTGIVDEKTLLEFVFTDKSPAQIDEIMARNKIEREEKRKLEMEQEKSKQDLAISNTDNGNTVKDKDVPNPPK
jgi:hypothetical protein